MRHVRTFILSAALHKHAVGPTLRWAITGRPATRSPLNNRAPTRRISRPNLRVFAVAAAGVLCAFPARWTRYLNSVSAAGPVQIPFSLPFLERSSYRVNAVQLHVSAADVLVRPGVDGDGFR